MVDINQLKKATDEFFQKYWSIEKNGPQPYKWEDKAWEFSGGIPNNDKKGCYALVKGDEVRYIGVGIGNSTERYIGSGLGDRLKRYWQVNPSLACGTQAGILCTRFLTVFKSFTF